MKKKFIKVEKDKFDTTKREVDKWRQDYWKVKDESDILKARIEEYKIGADRTINTLSDEIRDLKLILAGAVCKDNPFIDKIDKQVANVIYRQPRITG